MSFIATFRWSNYGLILVGMSSLCIARFLSPVVLIVPLIAIALMETPRSRHFVESLSRHLVNAISLIVFGCVLTDYLLFGRDLISDVIFFTVYLQILKILTARRNRDYFQIYTLALSHLILTTLLTIDTLFIVPFLLFIVLGPWCLTLYTLKARMEDAFLGPEKLRLKNNADIQDPRVQQLLRSRDAVSGRLFVVTAILSIVLLAHTLGIFFVFPRVSLGFLSRKTQYGDAISGFSEQVDLSSFGEIKNSDAVVMRVFPEPGVSYDSDLLYWRGLVFDVYDGREWMRRYERTRRAMINRASGEIRLMPGPVQGLIRQRIFLEPLDTDVLFALPNVTRVAWDPETVDRVLQRGNSPGRWGPSLALDRYGSMHFDGGLEMERVYTTYSSFPRALPHMLRTEAPGAGSEGLDAETYLRIPEFSEQFHGLVQKLTATEGNDYDRVQAVVTHLINRCDYTLDVPEQRGNPIEGFLFRQRQGHCEYFATAAAVILRAAGVPTRLVSGFRGGDWNRYGQYITVRQRHAHAWIEVFFPSHGWMPFDPTPPDVAAGGFRALRYQAMRHFIEWVELRWYNYVVNYGYDDQQRMAGGVVAQLRAWRASFQSGDWLLFWQENLHKERAHSHRRDYRTGLRLLTVAGCVAILVVVTLIIRRHRLSRRTGRRATRLAPAFYRQFLALTRRRGLVPEGSETPREFAARVAHTMPALAVDIDFLICTYYHCRYGGGRVQREEVDRIDLVLKQLSRPGHAGGVRS